jgi:hypothetical protein
VGTGGLSHDQTLFTLPSLPLLEGVFLSYNSTSQSGKLGTGWSHNHEIALTKRDNGAMFTLSITQHNSVQSMAKCIF